MHGIVGNILEKAMEAVTVSADGTEMHRSTTTNDNIGDDMEPFSFLPEEDMFDFGSPDPIVETPEEIIVSDAELASIEPGNPVEPEPLAPDFFVTYGDLPGFAGDVII